MAKGGLPTVGSLIDIDIQSPAEFTYQFVVREAGGLWTRDHEDISFRHEVAPVVSKELANTSFDSIPDHRATGTLAGGDSDTRFSCREGACDHDEGAA